eukprot:g3473.t1
MSSARALLAVSASTSTSTDHLHRLHDSHAHNDHAQDKPALTISSRPPPPLGNTNIKTAFPVLGEANVCPVASFERAMELNRRMGPRCKNGVDESAGVGDSASLTGLADNHSAACCKAIERAKMAADRAEREVKNNWFLRHCAVMPFPVGGLPRLDAEDEEFLPGFLEPFVEWMAAFRRWAGLVGEEEIAAGKVEGSPSRRDAEREERDEGD